MLLRPAHSTEDPVFAGKLGKTDREKNSQKISP